MVPHLGSLPFVESEVEGPDRSQGDDTKVDVEERHISMAVGVEGIVT